jgi:hypothetical protein
VASIPSAGTRIPFASFCSTGRRFPSPDESPTRARSAAGHYGATRSYRPGSKCRPAHRAWPLQRDLQNVQFWQHCGRPLVRFNRQLIARS